jgi:hypothetical protein
MLERYFTMLQRIDADRTCSVYLSAISPRCGIVGSAFTILVASLAAACSGATHETDSATSAASTTAFPNDKTAYDYFIAKGLTNFQAAAVVGNLDQESGVNPTISQENGGPGRGIAQWSAGGRWDSDAGDNLVAFAAKENLPTSSLTVQLDFIWYELTTFSDYGLATLRASTNVTDATTDFELGFEGCAIASECDASSRIAYAKSVLSAYGGTTPPPPPIIDAGSGTTPPVPPVAGAIHPKSSSSLCLAVSGKATANGSAVVVATCDGSTSQSWAFQSGTLRVYGTKCLDVPSGNTTNGTKLQIWDCGAGNTNQEWTEVGATIVWTGKGKCLDLTDGLAAAGTAAQSWSCVAGDTNQEW